MNENQSNYHTHTQKCMEVPKKSNIEWPYEPATSLTGCISTGHKISIAKTQVHIRVNSVNYSNQLKLKSPLNNNENEVHIHNGMLLLNHKNERILVTW